MVEDEDLWPQDDQLEALLESEDVEASLPEVYSSVKFSDDTDFVENRKCAKCVGECKVF